MSTESRAIQVWMYGSRVGYPSNIMYSTVFSKNIILHTAPFSSLIQLNHLNKASHLLKIDRQRSQLSKNILRKLENLIKIYTILATQRNNRQFKSQFTSIIFGRGLCTLFDFSKQSTHMGLLISVKRFWLIEMIKLKTSKCSIKVQILVLVYSYAFRLA